MTYDQTQDKQYHKHRAKPVCGRVRPWAGPQRTIVRGDSCEASIAAASVLAKEARDGLIRRLAKRFPEYGLERHVGYGTARHRDALLASGPTPLHRLSFLTKLFAAP